MTNEELLAKIKAEIERLMECVGKASRELKDFTPYMDGELSAYEDILDFLSDLEEQAKEVRNPIFDECVANVDPEVREEVRRNIELEEEIEKRYDQAKWGYVDGVGEVVMDKGEFTRIARHFYELGCRRTAEKYDEVEYNRQREEENVPNDLEEAKEAYCEEHNDDCFDAIGSVCPHIIEAFIAGAKWQANHTPLPEDTALFQKGVAEGKRLMMEEAEECELYWDGDFLAIDLNMAALGYSERDKVRVIVLKKEDEK